MRHRMSVRPAWPAVALLALTAFTPHPPATASEGAAVGRWKTFVLTSGAEVGVPAPPADDAAQTAGEIAELRALQTLRTPLTNQVVQYWNAPPATKRWVDLTHSLIASNRLPGIRVHRARAIVLTAMHDAVVAAYNAKYTHNRKAPALLATDLVTLSQLADEPSYPSEHAAMAAAAAGTLAYLFPQETASLAALAREAGASRLLAGMNYRSDVNAGFALGEAVAARAIARAQSDGSAVQWTGTVPKGAGLWTGTAPLEPLGGTWKPYLLTSGSQLRPGPPPAFGSPRFLAELAEVKRVNQSLSPSERQIATFWGTVPSSLFFDMAHTFIARDGLSTPQAARIQGVLAAAYEDAAITSYETKFHYWSIRPAQADPTIVPIVTEPAQPSYISNGATHVATLANLIAHFFPGETERMRVIEQEAALARMYGGIHFRSDIEVGMQIGRRIAAIAAEWDRETE